ncbi:MAG: hypothetical protein JW900_11505 [Anaerolineae bacterium]|nr:hypothetical protein [Anaerolineae bacterium]
MLAPLHSCPAQVEQVGWKGWGLRWLESNGFPVPPTWLLAASAFDEAIVRTGVAREVAEIGWSLRGVWNDWTAAQRVLDGLEKKRAGVARALRRASLPNQLGRQFERLALMPTQWAVRSSAAGEGGKQYPFAGLFLSLLSVLPGAAVWNGVQQVWASTFRREALLYCAQNDLSLPRMAVILHPMAPITPFDRSGRVYSHSPLPSLPGTLVQLTGDTAAVYSCALGRWFRVELPGRSNEKGNVLVTGGQGGLELQPAGEGNVLRHEEARQLAQLVQAVAERWGAPVTVEFVWRVGGEPLLVQAQPTSDEVMHGRFLELGRGAGRDARAG